MNLLDKYIFSRLKIRQLCQKWPCCSCWITQYKNYDICRKDMIKSHINRNVMKSTYWMSNCLCRYVKNPLCINSMHRRPPPPPLHSMSLVLQSTFNQPVSFKVRVWTSQGSRIALSEQHIGMEAHSGGVCGGRGEKTLCRGPQQGILVMLRRRGNG